MTAPALSPHAQLSARFRAAMAPDFLYCDPILEAAKTDPVTEVLVLAHLALPGDQDLRSRLIFAMGIRQGELAGRRAPPERCAAPEYDAASKTFFRCGLERGHRGLCVRKA